VWRWPDRPRLPPARAAGSRARALPVEDHQGGPKIKDLADEALDGTGRQLQLPSRIRQGAMGAPIGALLGYGDRHLVWRSPAQQCLDAAVGQSSKGQTWHRREPGGEVELFICQGRNLTIEHLQRGFDHRQACQRSAEIDPHPLLLQMRLLLQQQLR